MPELFMPDHVNCSFIVFFACFSVSFPFFLHFYVEALLIRAFWDEDGMLTQHLYTSEGGQQ